jgi:hypothetical protein
VSLHRTDLAQCRPGRRRYLLERLDERPSVRRWGRRPACSVARVPTERSQHTVHADANRPNDPSEDAVVPSRPGEKDDLPRQLILPLLECGTNAWRIARTVAQLRRARGAADHCQFF